METLEHAKQIPFNHLPKLLIEHKRDAIKPRCTIRAGAKNNLLDFFSEKVLQA